MTPSGFHPAKPATYQCRLWGPVLWLLCGTWSAGHSGWPMVSSKRLCSCKAWHANQPSVRSSQCVKTLAKLVYSC